MDASDSQKNVERGVGGPFLAKSAIYAPEGIGSRHVVSWHNSRPPFFAIHSGAADEEGGQTPADGEGGRDYVVVKNVCPSGPFIIT